MPRISIVGKELMIKVVKDGRTSGIIYTPREYIGKKVALIFETIEK